MDFTSAVDSCAHADSAGCQATGLDLGRDTREEKTAATDPMAGKRRWPRFAVDMPVCVRVTTQGPTRTLVCEGQGTDISCGGLAVTVEIELAVGAQIMVEFTPPNSTEPITFRGFVRNRKANKYGVEFIAENDRDYVNTGMLQQCLARESEKVTKSRT